MPTASGVASRSKEQQAPSSRSCFCLMHFCRATSLGYVGCLPSPSRLVHDRQRTSQSSGGFHSLSHSLGSCEASTRPRNQRPRAKLRGITVSPRTVSKTVSGGFPLTRVRILPHTPTPPPPFAGIFRDFAGEQRANYRPFHCLIASRQWPSMGARGTSAKGFIPSPFPPSADCTGDCRYEIDREGLLLRAKARVSGRLGAPPLHDPSIESRSEGGHLARVRGPAVLSIVVVAGDRVDDARERDLDRGVVRGAVVCRTRVGEHRDVVAELDCMARG